MDPRDVASAIALEIQDGCLIIAAGRPIAETSDTFEMLSRAFQSLAVCRLLESGDVAKFRDNLARSGFARRFFLSRSAQQGNTDDRRLALSRTEAFFDALAAGHGLLAREIASLSLDTWHEGWEYKDDFYYFLFLHRLVMEPALLGQTASAGIVRQFEEALEGDTPPRLEVLQALSMRDATAFGAALRALMEGIDTKLQARKALLMEPDVEAFLHWPRTFVSAEGLALIAIARAMKIDVADDIPLCPVIARLAMAPVTAEDPFLGIEAELRRSGG